MIFIDRAVNAHEILVRALEEIVKGYDFGHGPTGTCQIGHNEGQNCSNTEIAEKALKAHRQSGRQIIMKIFRIWQEVNNDYDTYSDAVVIAKDKEDARKIHPSDINKVVTVKPDPYDTWCGIGYVQVQYIGNAKPGSKRSIVCSSFHAG